MKTATVQPKLTLVGAGPGDPDLISVKGIKALADADVVLYDALVSKELLAYAPDRAEKIFVGKRAGQHSHTQDAINELIVHFAHDKGHVVRLKGGDPFVFGRGFEEIKYAEQNGVATSMVPGISSASAVPAMQNIPITSRGVNHSFWVVTGTTKEGELSSDVAIAAQSSATVVILMGTRKLEQICNIFSAHGKAETPVAIIQNGTMPNEKMVKGTITSIATKAREEGVGAPAIIVIGETVNLYDEELAPVVQQNMISTYYG